jgi:hypothetical protein
MQIRKKDIDSINLSDFSFNNSVFSSFEWIKKFDNHEFYLIYEKGNSVIGGFVIQKSSLVGFHIIKNLPYTPTISLFFNNKSKNYSNANSNIKHLMDCIADFFDSSNNLIVKFALPFGFNDLQPFIWRKYKVIPNYTYRLNLNNSIENLVGNMSPQRRNELKKGEKDGILVRRNFDNELVLSVINKTFDRKELKVSTNILRRILFDFANESNSYSFVAFKNERPIATAFCIYDNDVVYYLLGGYDNFNKHQSAGAMCVWNSVLHAKEIGKSVFDFEGSMLKPVERYFRDFGGELSTYYTVNKAILPIEMLLKFIKREYF